MRKAARIDDNQNQLVRNLRAIGASVKVLSMVGKGFPDIAVGWNGNNYLFEIKDPNKVPSKRKLTPDEQVFFDTWSGQRAIVETIEDCLTIMNK